MLGLLYYPVNLMAIEGEVEEDYFVKGSMSLASSGYQADRLKMNLIAGTDGQPDDLILSQEGRPARVFTVNKVLKIEGSDIPETDWSYAAGLTVRGGSERLNITSLVDVFGRKDWSSQDDSKDPDNKDKPTHIKLIIFLSALIITVLAIVAIVVFRLRQKSVDFESDYVDAALNEERGVQDATIHNASIPEDDARL